MDDTKKAVNAPERLIDGNELMEWLKGKIRECVVLNAHAEAATTEEIIRYVKHMPAVDAMPMVHGRWSEKRWMTEDDWGVINHRAIVCSACKEEIADGEKTCYCPNCGAKMDDKRRNEDATN